MRPAKLRRDDDYKVSRCTPQLSLPDEKLGYISTVSRWIARGSRLFSPRSWSEGAHVEGRPAALATATERTAIREPRHNRDRSTTPHAGWKSSGGWPGDPKPPRAVYWLTSFWGRYILWVPSVRPPRRGGRGKREPGESPGLPRSGERERKPPEALSRWDGKRRRVGVGEPSRPACPRVRRPADGPLERFERSATRAFAGEAGWQARLSAAQPPFFLFPQVHGGSREHRSQPVRRCGFGAATGLSAVLVCHLFASEPRPIVGPCPLWSCALQGGPHVGSVRSDGHSEA